jgi:hypothetical protein
MSSIYLCFPVHLCSSEQSNKYWNVEENQVRCAPENQAATHAPTSSARYMQVMVIHSYILIPDFPVTSHHLLPMEHCWDRFLTHTRRVLGLDKVWKFGSRYKVLQIETEIRSAPSNYTFVQLVGLIHSYITCCNICFPISYYQFYIVLSMSIAPLY